MNSQRHEEIRRRRAKATTGRFNPYQKMVMVAGGLTLFSLAIGISPQLGSFLVAAIVGGMITLFLIFKTRRRRKEEEAIIAPEEVIPEREVPEEARPIPHDSMESNSRQIDSENVLENTPSEPEESAEKEDLKDLPEAAGEGVLAQILGRLASAEGKVSRLEDRVMDLEEKVSGYEEERLKSESKIDLQTILAQLDEKKVKFS